VKTITTPSGNRISVNGISLRGRERIFYNDELVSDKFSMLGGTYFFEKKELGKIVQYEVKFGTRWNSTCWHEMRIDGKIFFSDR
jgi:hypothetical protein